MDTLGKAELTASIRHIAIFLKSEILIYNSQVPDAAGRKTRRGRRRTQALCVSRKPNHQFVIFNLSTPVE